MRRTVRELAGELGIGVEPVVAELRRRGHSAGPATELDGPLADELTAVLRDRPLRPVAAAELIHESLFSQPVAAVLSGSGRKVPGNNGSGPFGESTFSPFSEPTGSGPARFDPPEFAATRAEPLRPAAANGSPAGDADPARPMPAPRSPDYDPFAVTPEPDPWAAAGFDPADRAQWVAAGLTNSDVDLATRCVSAGVTPAALSMNLSGRTGLNRLRDGEGPTSVWARVQEAGELPRRGTRLSGRFQAG